MSKANLANLFAVARKRWGGNGSGSTAAKTEVLADNLPRLLSAYNVRRVVDLGCGDVEWIIPIARSLDEYVGVDVCGDVIERNVARCGSGTIRFMQISGPDDELPACDLVISRDCLAHLPNVLAGKSLSQAARAAPLLLATTHPSQRNLDIPTAGGFRPLNLSIKPFHLGLPIAMVSDSDRKMMGLWPIRDRLATQPPFSYR